MDKKVALLISGVVVFAALVAGVFILNPFQSASFRDAYYAFADKFVSGDRIEYKKIISLCRIKTTDACVARFDRQGLERYDTTDANTSVISSSDDGKTDVLAQYPKSALISLYFDAVQDNNLADRIPRIPVANGQDTPFYAVLFNESLQAGINPELVSAISQITTGTIEGNYTALPSVLDLGQSNIQDEVRVLAQEFAKSEAKYDPIVTKGDFSQLSSRFSKHSMTNAILVSKLSLGSVVYLDVINKLYGNKPYYHDLIDLNPQNPNSFYSVYFRYAMSDPRNEL